MHGSFTSAVLLLTVTFGCNTDRNSTSKPATKTKSRVVFRVENRRELTTENLANISVAFEYEIMTTDHIPDKANELHQKARQFGAAGKYEQAIELFSQAHVLAPGWPYPTYDMAFTYLLMKDFANARKCYQKTVKLSPRGFFTALTALHTLDREATGDLPEGTYAAYMSLEWIDDPGQKAKMVTALVERLPNFAPAWKELALQCDEPSERLSAIEKGLVANPDSETKGVLLINKALTLNQQGDTTAAREILGNLALDPNATFANEHLAKQILAMIAE